MTYNLSNPKDRDALSKRVKDEIDEWSAKHYDGGFRDHLGASLLGKKCYRALWYTFRWCKAPEFNGRMQRLFQVGHTAEDRFITYLKAIGFAVSNIDPTTGKQYRISAHNGHYGGSCDGICKPPERYGLSTDLVFLNEFKTNGTGTGYSNVAIKGLQEAKPEHWAQMCQYGYKLQLKYGLYLIENKNDSDLTIQIVELDWRYGMELINKAGDIIDAKVPPQKISNQPSFFECKYCKFVDICHHGVVVDTNCRSCKFATPVENAEWKCYKYGVIPKEYILKGCSEHCSVNE